MKKIAFILISLILNSCWPCRTDPITIENGNLPDSILSCIPYQQDSIYKLQHSNGLVVNFKTSKERYDEWTSCDYCCDYKYHYEISKTTLIADYPLFDIQFWLDNQDTFNYWCSLSVGKYGFTIPITNLEYTDMYDSIIIDTKSYFNVLKLKSSYDTFYNKDSIYVDSLYYNYTDGIIKLLMSNGESYEAIP